MTRIIYVDVLIVINFIIDYFLLKLTQKLLAISISFPRLLFCAGLASLSSLLIFLPKQNFIFVINLFFSGIIIGIAFGFPVAKKSLGPFLYRVFLFYGINFLFSGIMFVIYLWRKPPKMLLYNGILYLQISPLWLILTSAGIYGILSAFQYVTSRRKITTECRQLVLHWQGREQTIYAFPDTGNHLREPFSNSPVIVASLQDVKPILGEELWKTLDSNAYLTEKGAVVMSKYMVRLIPYTAVGVQSTLPAIKLDDVSMEQEEGKSLLKIPSVYLAITASAFHGSYSAIFHPDLLKSPSYTYAVK